MEVFDFLTRFYARQTGITRTVTESDRIVVHWALPKFREVSLEAALTQLVTEQQWLPERVSKEAQSQYMFGQPCSFLVLWLTKRQPNITKSEWPLTHDLLRPFFSLYGTSFDFD